MPSHGLDGALQVEERDDLDDAADGDHDENAEDEEERIPLQDVMPGEKRPAVVRLRGAAHGLSSSFRRLKGRLRRRAACSDAVIVM